MTTATAERTCVNRKTLNVGVPDDLYALLKAHAAASGEALAAYVRRTLGATHSNTTLKKALTRNLGKLGLKVTDASTDNNTSVKDGEAS